MPGSESMWMGRISQVGQTDWFSIPVRGNHVFTIVTQALDETGAPTERQRPCPPSASGMSFDACHRHRCRRCTRTERPCPRRDLAAAFPAAGDDIVRIGIADVRGDGRPDYAYSGFPALRGHRNLRRASQPGGGPIVIRGMGFRSADIVTVGGQPALVTSISGSEITADAPPLPPAITGSVDVEVDDQPSFLYAATIVGGGVSYDSGKRRLNYSASPHLRTPFPLGCRWPSRWWRLALTSIPPAASLSSTP